MSESAQAPEDLLRLIEQAENAHNEVHIMYQKFIQVVKHECVMDNHFFTFTSLPELIVRKNYTRKQYEQISKLLVGVKNSYLEFRSKKEPDDVDE